MPTIRNRISLPSLSCSLEVCTVMHSVFVAGCDGTSLSGLIDFQPLDIGMYL